MNGLRISRMKRLESKFANAVSIFSKTITALEQSNKEYDILAKEIDAEVISLAIVANEIDTKRDRNNMLLEKFRNFLN